MENSLDILKLLKEEDDSIIADTRHTIYGYKFRCIKKQINYKVEERWYCLKEGEGQDLPRYIRENAHGTGYKSLNTFFSSLGFYKHMQSIPKPLEADAPDFNKIFGI